MNKILKSKKAFTLIELLVVIAVIAILVMLATPRFIGYTKDANVSGLKTDTKMLSNIATIYHIEHGEYPTTEDTITVSGKTMHKIDESAVASEYKSLKNPLDSYAIDPQSGDVFHITGVEDRSGEVWFNEVASASKAPEAGESSISFTLLSYQIGYEQSASKTFAITDVSDKHVHFDYEGVDLFMFAFRVNGVDATELTFERIGDHIGYGSYEDAYDDIVDVSIYAGQEYNDDYPPIYGNFGLIIKHEGIEVYRVTLTTTEP